MDAVKKTWLIDQNLVTKARKICGARTETETVTLALREIIVRNEIERAFERQGPILASLEEVFPDNPTPDPARSRPRSPRSRP